MAAREAGTAAPPPDVSYPKVFKNGTSRSVTLSPGRIHTTASALTTYMRRLPWQSRRNYHCQGRGHGGTTSDRFCRKLSSIQCSCHHVINKCVLFMSGVAFNGGSSMEICHLRTPLTGRSRVLGRSSPSLGFNQWQIVFVFTFTCWASTGHMSSIWPQSWQTTLNYDGCSSDFRCCSRAQIDPRFR